MARLYYVHNDTTRTVELEPGRAVYVGPETCVQAAAQPGNDGEETDAGGATCGSGVVIVPVRCGATVRHAVLGSSADLRVNGLPFDGIRALREHDEVALPNGDLFIFSLEERAVVATTLPKGLNALCPICRDPIEPPAVRCPWCGVWHHESETRPCWSAGEVCSTYGCGHPTALDCGSSPGTTPQEGAREDTADRPGVGGWEGGGHA